ncbi:TPA: hypothetical protein NJ199_002306 [Vibrio parahaemolyticus]|nr:hypothetical protein [Vibrio parahaemolyticus]
MNKVKKIKNKVLLLVATIVSIPCSYANEFLTEDFYLTCTDTTFSKKEMISKVGSKINISGYGKTETNTIKSYMPLGKDGVLFFLEEKDGYNSSQKRLRSVTIEPLSGEIRIGYNIATIFKDSGNLLETYHKDYTEST